MNCNTSIQCHWPLGDCTSSNNLSQTFCICSPGFYSLFSSGDACDYNSDPWLWFLEIVLLVLHLCIFCFCLYKLHCLSEYVPSPLAFPKLLCYNWLMYSITMVIFLLIMTSRSLIGSALDTCAKILGIISVACLLGPMLYSVWFTTFVIQLVRQTTHHQRHVISGMFYALSCLFELLLFICSILIAVKGNDTYIIAGYILFAFNLFCMSIVLLGAPFSVCVRYCPYPPSLIVEMKWTWFLHFILGFVTLVAAVSTLVLSIFLSQQSDQSNLFTFVVYYLIIWMLLFGMIVFFTINHKQSKPDNQANGQHYHRIE